MYSFFRDFFQRISPYLDFRYFAKKPPYKILAFCLPEQTLIFEKILLDFYPDGTV